MPAVLGCVCVFFVILFNSMPHYMVILHALHNLNFSFTITFMLIVTQYNVGNNVWTSKLKINKFSGIYLSFIVKHHCNSVKSIDVCVCVFFAHPPNTHTHTHTHTHQLQRSCILKLLQLEVIVYVFNHLVPRDSLTWCAVWCWENHTAAEVFGHEYVK